MRRRLPFILLLLAAFIGLAVVADSVVARMTRRWFDDDLNRRARLAVTAARPALTGAWTDSTTASLESMLAGIAKDERILGVAACRDDGTLMAATAAFPVEFTCGAARAPYTDSGPRASASLKRSGLHLTVVPLDMPRDTGLVLVVQDPSFVGGRQAASRSVMLALLVVMGIAASAVTVWFAQLARRRWVDDFRRLLAGDGDRESAQFAPLLRDVRRLARSLADEQVSVDRVGPWTPERLRNTMQHDLQGERLVVLANREPFIHVHTDDGIRVMHPASGLVTALEPVLRACSGVWVAHGAGSADREVVDARDLILVPPDAPAYQLRRVWLTDEEEQGYYYGFANEALWPLCHVAHARPTFRADDWAQYRRVNEKFADAVCEEAESDDPIILVQDYHFALAPRLIRDRKPRATVITFWHIPWPNAERIGICPWRDELLDGLLGSSILAFHTQQHCNHFLDAVDSYVESRIDREATAIVQGDHRTLVRNYPISVEWPVRWLSDMPSVAACRRSLRRRLDLPDDALIGLGVDRLDYTKGIEERLTAVEALLRDYPEFRGRFTFVQVAAPSRTRIRRYQDLEREVSDLVAEINERWGTPGYRPIRLLREHVEPPDVFRMMRGADLMYVSSLHDGMNLVAKEFVAARDDEQGVLVLSKFTGAARELSEALVVNPYDIAQSAAAMATALRMSPSEQRERMNAMRRLVAEFNVYRWAASMLLEAADLRRRARLTDQFTSVGAA